LALRAACDAAGDQRLSRHARHGIARAALVDGAGCGVAVLSDGRQHARATIEGAVVLMQIHDHSGFGHKYVLSGFAQNAVLGPAVVLSGQVRIGAARSLEETR
jgi:hypothetical protein